LTPLRRDVSPSLFVGVYRFFLSVNPNDNLAVHKQPAVRAAIEAVGAHLRFLPPYSPDFNPIELAFAKLKAFIRAARPRTFDHVCDLIAVALGLFTPAECRNFIRHLRISSFYSAMKNVPKG
jgi:transposase